jgi:HD-GYP domain-containing protein (c-di-GMP phosphodiesterase class II)
MFTDLKGLHLVGHSRHVASLAAGAAELMGMTEAEVGEVRAASLLHDLGRVAVSSEIWDRPGELGPADRERVQLHPYWTERILMRYPAVAPLAVIAGAHHERLNGAGYHRRARTRDFPLRSPARGGRCVCGNDRDPAASPSSDARRRGGGACR